MYTIWTAELPYINHVSHRFTQRGNFFSVLNNISLPVFYQVFVWAPSHTGVVGVKAI